MSATITIEGTNLTVPSLVEVVSALRGRYGGLRQSKPEGNGMLAYCWRIARFNAGHDLTMPVGCFFDLQTEVEKQTGVKYPDGPIDVCGIISPGGKRLLDILDFMSDAALTALGMNTSVAARRWAQAGLVSSPR